MADQIPTFNVETPLLAERRQAMISNLNKTNQKKRRRRKSSLL
jgi:hypothetical protein